MVSVLGKNKEGKKLYIIKSIVKKNKRLYVNILRNQFLNLYYY